MDVKENNQVEAHGPQNPQINLKVEVNGVNYQLQVGPADRLVDILRDAMGLTGTKISCEIGRCGACAVHLNGKLVNSCLVMAYQANDSSICTIEGVAEEELHPIQSAFLEEGGYQCGYCTPGMIMAVKALLDKNPDPTEEQIQEALSGNLCRCTGYGGIIRSVQRAVSSLREKQVKSSPRLSIEEVNQMNKDEFVNSLGWIFEHSPWVASIAWESLPFKSREELLQNMVLVVKNAAEALQVTLLRAHPDLGTRLQISEVSQKEQAGVGLDRLSKEEHREFVALNQRYVEQFSFPFIMAVKGKTKDTILAAMQERVGNTYELEFQTALNEVYKIAGFRLNDVIQ